MIRIRPSVPADAPFIISANRRMALETEGLELDPELLEPGVRKALADPSLGRYFIAESGGKAVGQLMLTFEWSDWRNGQFWWIQSVFVEPEHRQQGVFGALYRHAEETARASGTVCGLRLYVEKDNHRARRIYERLGMHMTGYDMLEVTFRGPASHRHEPESKGD